jgi:Uma2 family endonuclease
LSPCVEGGKMESGMSASLIQVPPSEPPRKRWTRAEYALLDSVLPGQHLELVEGELISKMGKKRPHVSTLAIVAKWLSLIFGEEFITREAPIDVSPEDNPTSEPEPDVTVLNRPYGDFTNSNPAPSDVRLVVEVSDSTVSFDLTTKAGLYARAGISEYWVVDIAKRRLIVHRDPNAGKYQSVLAYSDQESIAPLSAPEHPFVVASAFLS